MTERRAPCYCGRRTINRFGLTDDTGAAHTREFCGQVWAEVGKLRAEVTERDRRIEFVLSEAKWYYCSDERCTVPSCAFLRQMVRVLRGETDGE